MRSGSGVTSLIRGKRIAPDSLKIRSTTTRAAINRGEIGEIARALGEHKHMPIARCVVCVFFKCFLGPNDKIFLRNIYLCKINEKREEMRKVQKSLFSFYLPSAHFSSIAEIDVHSCSMGMARVSHEVVDGI